MSQTAVPVVFIIFNRPALTKRVFEKIREAQPEQLFIIADGPRPDKKYDMQRCQETRAIVETIDWPCQVQRNYSEHNLGCGKRIASGLDWVFEHCDQAIILEDDCVPSNDFFLFCAEMLSRYEHDTRIMSISGFSAPTKKTAMMQQSYYYSKFFGMWGWATWKRAWQQYDFAMRQWPEEKKRALLKKQIGNDAIARQMERDLDNVYTHNGEKGIVDTWDFQFALAHLRHEGYAIKPTVNLVANIGVGDPGATHTVLPNKLGSIPTTPLRWPLVHPELVQWNREADIEVFQTYYQKSALLFRVKQAMKKIPFVPGLVKKVLYRA